MKTYNTYSFSDSIDWSIVPEEKLEFSNWNSATSYNTYFKMCFLRKSGIYVKMRTDERKLRAVCQKRDDPVWQDSCMEFFICAVEGREEYINFEMNSVGAYLTEFGKGKSDRVFLRCLTEAEPEITTSVNPDGWSLELFIPCELINEAYKTDFDAGECILKGNFYKCGDETEKVHYDSYTEMTTLPPGFHNPECFAVIKIIER
ncbi:MAG: carbohydrate-binding family 9-like protein [Clostridia bacterium]|nr:carbohydrate-binding family 9-like protein [Clostridia bacterium]